ncbi:hypothetical protein [Flectobacillus sp. BAB-3569]|jgi:hypothetical protein|uniref:hypothetical protein n=1 Tax=Flectobacillus sp. BAB-3569 TaxID=1509483 RepID=UPI000BA2F980|nr:hypothetical protein [Flectobacillus sp. BAB-3569]NBA78595.1 hypothetical protein [Emticicia sp. ODNR4P]PAC27057.1 hypothetical protein BWI92_24370 [Flectobacillus sp. BAB-3569]
MDAVRFRVLAIEGKRSTNSDIQVGGTYVGEANDLRNRVYYTDQAGDDWIFYVDDTCEIIDL